MNALPRFFVLSAIAGVALWLSGGPMPFDFLGKAILVASSAGFVLSSTYLHEFRPWQWRSKIVVMRRMLRAMGLPVGRTRHFA